MFAKRTHTSRQQRRCGTRVALCAEATHIELHESELLRQHRRPRLSCIVLCLARVVTLCASVARSSSHCHEAQNVSPWPTSFRMEPGNLAGHFTYVVGFAWIWLVLPRQTLIVLAPRGHVRANAGAYRRL